MRWRLGDIWCGRFEHAGVGSEPARHHCNRSHYHDYQETDAECIFPIGKVMSFQG